MPVHSDRGSQYVSGLFLAQRVRMWARGRISRKGNFGKNAAHKSSSSALFRALLEDTTFENRLAVYRAVLEFIEVFDNRQRRHSPPGDLTSHEFDRQATAASLERRNIGAGPAPADVRCVEVKQDTQNVHREVLA